MWINIFKITNIKKDRLVERNHLFSLSTINIFFNVFITIIIFLLIIISVHGFHSLLRNFQPCLSDHQWMCLRLSLWQPLIMNTVWIHYNLYWKKFSEEIFSNLFELIFFDVSLKNHTFDTLCLGHAAWVDSPQTVQCLSPILPHQCLPFPSCVMCPWLYSKSHHIHKTSLLHNIVGLASCHTEACPWKKAMSFIKWCLPSVNHTFWNVNLV